MSHPIEGKRKCYEKFMPHKINKVSEWCLCVMMYHNCESSINSFRSGHVQTNESIMLLGFQLTPAGLGNGWIHIQILS